MMRAMEKYRDHAVVEQSQLLVGKVRRPSWRKGFPGAEVGKTGGSWPGEDGLEYSRERWLVRSPWPEASAVLSQWLSSEAWAGAFQMG